MFQPLEPGSGPRARVFLDGTPVDLPEGANLAAALLTVEFSPFRTTPVSGAPRLPFCMMGVCFDCLIEIDGIPNRQACLEQVRAGMRLRRQSGAANLEAAE